MSAGRFAWRERGGCVTDLDEKERVSWHIRVRKEVTV